MKLCITVTAMLDSLLVAVNAATANVLFNQSNYSLNILA